MVNCIYGNPNCKVCGNKKLNERIQAVGHEEQQHLTGFAPFTPVTVSAKTKPTTATAISNRVRQDETIRDELWDGFNPFGSGPEPIGRRE